MTDHPENKTADISPQDLPAETNLPAESFLAAPGTTSLANTNAYGIKAQAEAHKSQSAQEKTPVCLLQDVVSIIGGFPALSGLSLRLYEDQITLIQGPNGAGKTTLLRLLAGLLSIRSGSASVFGHDLSKNRRAVRALCGITSPEPALYGALSVEENLRFWARVHASTSTGNAVAVAMNRLGISDIAAQRCETLSTGQKRRVGLASLVIRRPRLWLLDEPHAGLDQAGRNIVDEVVLQAADAGATVLICSHELERVRRIASRTVTLAGGVVVEDSLWEKR